MISNLLSLIAFTLLFLLHQQTSLPKESFPQHLWTFWDGNLDNPKTDILLKLCLNNMNEYAVKSGWQFHLVTYDNLPQFLTGQNQDNCLRLLGMVDSKFKQMRADIIRLYLLKENGGMWVDSSSFFVQDLTWINEIGNITIPLLNKIVVSPDLVTFRKQQYDKPSSLIFDEQLKQEVYQSPGLENWAIIAKKDTPFISDSLKIIEQILTDEETLKKKIKQNQVVLSSYAQNSYFRFGIYTFQLVLQFKQHELDLLHQKDLGAVNTPKYAVEHYKIWTINAEEMGFNLQDITDGLVPFFPFFFLSSNVSTLENIQLRGFIKLGGVKRKYTETTLETLINPEMCLVAFDDAYRITNESYLYAYLIKNNQQSTGLALKESINNFKTKQEREKICEETLKKNKLEYVSESISSAIEKICVFIAVVFFCSILWIKHNKLLIIPKKNFLIPLLILLSVFLAIFLPLTLKDNQNILASDGTCSGVVLQSDSKELDQTQVYYQQLRSSLPKDNGTFFQMFFQENVIKLKDDFSSFVHYNRSSYLGYFSSYLIGITLCFVLLFASSSQKTKAIIEKCRPGTRPCSLIRIFSLCLLGLILVLSIVVLVKAFALNSSVKESICFMISLPNYFQNKNKIQDSVIAENSLNYIQFSDIMHEQFQNISMAIIVFRKSLEKESTTYFKQLTEAGQEISSFQTHQPEVISLLHLKITLLKNLLEGMGPVKEKLICENRIMEAYKLIKDNIVNLTHKTVFFMNNFLSSETLPFLTSAILITMAFLFTAFSFLLFLNRFKPTAQNYQRSNNTLLLLAVLGIILSFGLNCLVLSNYYFCDFVNTYRNSLENSSDFFMTMMPTPCMSQTTSDILLQDLSTNFDHRQQPFRKYLKLSPKVESLEQYPFAREEQLLANPSFNSETLSSFRQSNLRYNKKIQDFSKLYFSSKQNIQASVEREFYIPPNKNLLSDLQTMLFQPICSFNFNLLYQLTYYFTYLSFLNLFAYFISLISSTPFENISKNNKDANLETREEDVKEYQLSKSNAIMKQSIVLE